MLVNLCRFVPPERKAALVRTVLGSLTEATRTPLPAIGWPLRRAREWKYGRQRAFLGVVRHSVANCRVFPVSLIRSARVRWHTRKWIRFARRDNVEPGNGTYSPEAGGIVEYNGMRAPQWTPRQSLLRFTFRLCLRNELFITKADEWSTRCCRALLCAWLKLRAIRSRQRKARKRERERGGGKREKDRIVVLS